VSARAAIPPLAYRADIDGMRAVAVMLVLIFHFSSLTGINAGFLGVDIFFVISGFLITSILLVRVEANSFRLATFYIGRIRRLAPALFAVLLLTMVVAVVWLFPNELIDLSKQVLAAQLYVANIYFRRTVNYFDWGAQIILLHTWSLAVEEQFYLVYPACVFLLLRYFCKQFWAMIAAGFLLSFFLNIAFAAAKPEAVFYLLPTRAWELLAGAMVIPLAAKWARSRRIDELIALLGAGLIFVAVTCYRVEFHIPGFYALLPTLGTGCLLLSGATRTTGIAQILSWKPLVHVGRISYSLYLVHWPVYAFATQMFNDHSIQWTLAAFSLSVGLAEVVYHVVEYPVHRGRLFSSDRKLLKSYAAVLVITVSAVIVANVFDGLPQRFPAEVVRLASFAGDTTAPLIECQSLRQSNSRADESCHIGVVGQTPTWLVYGDSHAWASHALFDKWLKLHGQAGVLLFHHDCPPVNGVHFKDRQDGCFAFNQSISRFVEINPGIRDIVLVSLWDWPADGGLLNTSRTALAKDEAIRQFTDGFSQTLRHLHGLGRRVYVWEPVPGARASVPLALARAAWKHTSDDIEFDPAEYRSEKRLFFTALDSNRAWIAGTFSPAKILCASGKCIVENAGMPLYFDSMHMTKSTTDFWLQVLQEGAN
jgi:peptidoglycan/LPS O-acetylase OafA/YrhL